MSIHHQHPIVAATVAQCATDPTLRAQFLRSPRTVLRARGLTVPAEVQIVHLQNTETLTHLVVPGTYSAEVRTRLNQPGHRVSYLPADPKKLYVTL